MSLDISKVVQRRINRVRRQTDKTIAEKDAEIARLKAQVEGQQSTPPTEGEAAPTEGDEDPGPYPAKDDYESEQAWLDDTDDWYEGKKPSRAKQAAAASEAAPTSTPDSKRRPQDDPVQPYRERFDDVEEAIDEWDEAPDNLLEDFRSGLAQERIKLSPTMLEFMSDSDDGARIVAKLVEAPRESRRIWRKPPSKQVEELKRLLSGTGGKPANPETNGESPLPEIQRLSGRGNARRKTLEEAESFGEYFALRNEQGSGDGDPFGLPG